MIKKEDLLKIYNEVFNNEKPYQKTIFSESSGKTEELSIIDQMKKDYPQLQIEKGDDFIALERLKGQIKNSGISLLCSYDLGKIQDSGKVNDVNELVKPIFDKIVEGKEINFFEISGSNIYFRNEHVDNFSLNYVGLYQIMCIYSKNSYTLYNPVKYCYGKKFKCEIRSSGKNHSALIAINYVKEKLKDYKKEEYYVMKKDSFEQGKARNKNEKSSRIKIKELPNCFFVTKIEDVDSDYCKFKLSDMRQLTPAICFYVEN